MEEGIIALIGAGKGGVALLKVLLEIPGVKIKYVCDIDPDAAGIAFAKSHGLRYISDYQEILDDQEVSLIFEATGDPAIFLDLSRKKSPNISLIGAGGSKIIYNLLDAYNEINKNLNEYKANLEEKIVERTEELEKANLDLENEVLEYEKLSRKLQEINEEKSKYLLHATHQLKAPFSAIQSYADIILEGYAGEIPQRTRDIVLKIRQRCELLSNVIKEMLELSRLKSRDSEMRLETINISKIVSKVIQRFHVLAASKDIPIESEDLSEDFFIHGDKRQIDSLFSILVENAVHYSPKGRPVQVIFHRISDSRLLVGVKDQGIGISEKNINKVFNEFFRSNNAVEFHKNGTGLGLSIAKEIADMHNTSIQVESELGKGSFFSVIFKLV